MKKLIFINIVLFSFAFTNSKDSTNFKYTIYPELVGLGGIPSINIEYNINDYSLRAGIGMLFFAGIIYPIAIYRTYGINEIGLGLMFWDDTSIEVMATYNLKIKWNRRIFTRLGIIGGYSETLYGLSNSGELANFGILPTVGFGFNF